MSILIRNKKKLFILSQIICVIWIMKDNSSYGTMFMILWRIIYEPADSLNVNRLDHSHPMGLRLQASASLAAPPQEDFMAIGGASPEGVAIPELGIAPLIDPDADIEDELPTPEGSMLISDSSPEGIRLPGVSLAPPDLIDLELEEELLSVSVLPAMVTPLVEPVEAFPVTPSA